MLMYLLSYILDRAISQVQVVLILKFSFHKDTQTSGNLPEKERNTLFKI